MRLFLKLFLVLGMTLAILVPLLLIRGVIQDRQGYRAEAVADIARNYGGAQAFAGPVLVVPYTEAAEVEETDRFGVTRKVRREQTRQWTFFPATLDVRGPLVPGTRKRGLHEVRVYEWNATAKARFDVRIPDDADAGADRRVGRPWLGYGIADVRGLRSTPVLRVDGRALPVQEGVGSRAGPGLHVR